MIFDENYIIFLQKLTKEKLQSIIDDYNQLSNIFNFAKVDTKKMKKNDIISKIIEIKEPSITKLTFDDQELINIESVEIYV